METIRRNPELLSAFHAVATAGSFTRAAESIGGSKSLLSKHVKALETLLRTQLLVRTTRSLRLTEEGLALLAYADRISKLTDEADRRLREMSQGDSGTLRFTAPVSLGETLFPSLLTELRKELPNLRIELDLTNAHREIARDGIDFALRASEQNHPDAVSKSLGRCKDVLCASPNFIARNGAPTLPRDLARFETIRHSTQASWNRWSFERGTEHSVSEVTGSHATNLYGMMREFARGGSGIARLPLYFAQRDLAAGTLVSLLPDWEIGMHPLYFIYLREPYATARHRVAKRLVLAWFARHPELFLNRKT